MVCLTLSLSSLLVSLASCRIILTGVSSRKSSLPLSFSLLGRPTMTSSNGEVPTSDPTETASHESLPAALTASDKSSFAYPTMKDRVPTILCKTIDILHRCRTERTEAEREEVKKVVESLAKLRYQLQTNKAFEKIADQGDDQTVWNDVLAKATESGGGQAPKWFETTWLYAECYVYRWVFARLRLFSK